MQIDWQGLKETALIWTKRVALFWLAQTSLVYLWACIVSGKAIGPVEYIRFQYHVIQWRPQAAKASVRGAREMKKAGSVTEAWAPSASAAKFKPMSKTTTAEEVSLMAAHDESSRIETTLPKGTPVKILGPPTFDWLPVAPQIAVPGCPSSRASCWGYVRAGQLVPLAALATKLAGGGEHDGLVIYG